MICCLAAGHGFQDRKKERKEEGKLYHSKRGGERKKEREKDCLREKVQLITISREKAINRKRKRESRCGFAKLRVF